MEDQWYLISSRIRTERVARGLSAQELANRVGCSRATIHNWEHGKSVPLERCARLEQALNLEPGTMLALHPYAVPNNHEDLVAVDRVSMEPRRLAIVAGFAAILLVLATMFATWWIAEADCIEVGAGGGSMTGPFRNAFDRLGGQPLLGCAVGEVHKWGPGYVQDLEGGSAGRAALVTLDRENVFVLAGPMWWDYVAISGGATSDFAGLPTSNPLQCGRALVVLLDGGLDGPGALVSSPDLEYVWLSPDFWAAYLDAGGPRGPLGLPTGPIARSPNSQLLSFEGGQMHLKFGAGVAISPFVNLSRAEIPGDCNAVDIENLALR